jgi:hypothetical protein
MSEAALTPAAAADMEPAVAALPARRQWRAAIAGGAAIAGLVAILLLWWWLGSRPAPVVDRPVPTPNLANWELLAPLPTGRSGLAAAAYDDQIYAIAGETAAGPTGAVERYDTQTNTWQALAAKPLPVMDVAAATVGGLIYVPGGRLADGQVTNSLAVYDPAQDQWAERTPLPKALSAYALAAYEGKLYLFGGWDGRQYVADAFVFDPDADQWTSLTPLPRARGFAGAAVTAGRIYVIGGTDGAQALSRNDAYVPANEGTRQTPWQTYAPLPSARYAFGVATVAEIIHVVGGLGGEDGGLPLAFTPQRQEWERLSTQGPEIVWPISPAASTLGTALHVLGGRDSHGLTTNHASYQAVYAVLLPIIIK